MSNYLIQMQIQNGDTYLLRNSRHKTFHWHNHGQDKRYKTLTGAIKAGKEIQRKLIVKTSKIHIVQQTVVNGELVIKRVYSC